MRGKLLLLWLDFAIAMTGGVLFATLLIFGQPILAFVVFGTTLILFFGIWWIL